MKVWALVPDSIRARRRPLAILFVFAWELAWALVVATPAHAWARRVFGAHPDGDAALFVPGGADLLAWVGPMDAAEATVFRVTALLVLVGVILSQVPLGVLLASLALGRDETGRAPTLADARRASAATFLPLLTTLAVASALQIALLGLGGIAGSALAGALTSSLGEIGAARAGFAAFAPFAILVLALGVAADLVRAALVRDSALGLGAGADPGDGERAATAWGAFVLALGDAWRVGPRGFGRAFFAWAGRALAGLALVLLGALASSRLGGRGGFALFALFAIHQVAVLLRTALRASWLARALRFTSRSPG
jgi:hypothetical protein